MTIEASTVAPDSTGFATPTGGTSVGISLLKSPSAGKVIAKYDTETDFLTRTTIEFSIKDPVALSSAPGGYTQARSTVFIKKPMTLANGNRTVNTLSITLSRDPEMTSTALAALRLEACQFLGKGSFDDFYLSHSLI